MKRDDIIKKYTRVKGSWGITKDFIIAEDIPKMLDELAICEQPDLQEWNQNNPNSALPGFEHLPNDAQEGGIASDHTVYSGGVSEKPIKHVFGMLDSSDRDWIEDFGHENGNYQCNCIRCNKHFYGHKRRIVCKLCSHSTPEPIEPQKRQSTPEGDDKYTLGYTEGYEAHRLDVKNMKSHPTPQISEKMIEEILVFEYRKPELAWIERTAKAILKELNKQ